MFWSGVVCTAQYNTSNAMQRNVTKHKPAPHRPAASDPASHPWTAAAPTGAEPQQPEWGGGADFPDWGFGLKDQGD